MSPVLRGNFQPDFVQYSKAPEFCCELNVATVRSMYSYTNHSKGKFEECSRIGLPFGIRKLPFETLRITNELENRAPGSRGQTFDESIAEQRWESCSLLSMT